MGITGLNRPMGVVCTEYTDNATQFLNNPNTGIVTFIPFRNLYIADTGNNQIKFNIDGSTTASVVASGMNQPRGVTSDGFDSAWIGDTGNNALKKITSVCAYAAYQCNTAFKPLSTLFRSASPGSVLTTNPVAGATISIGTPANITIRRRSGGAWWQCCPHGR